MSEIDDTPARLVAAAERLFAEGGEEATSLRAITRAARSNAAAVHYHFGGRDELLAAVLDKQLGPLYGRRLQLVASAVQGRAERMPVEDLLMAALQADLDMLAKLRRHKVQVARFLGRSHTLPGTAVAEYLRRQQDHLELLLLPLLQQSLPEVDAAELGRRLRLVFGVVAMLFATAPGPDEPGPLGSDSVEEQLSRLVTFCAAGLSAKVISTSTRAPRKRKKRRPGT